jgi:phosphopantetheinyl transferase
MPGNPAFRLAENSIHLWLLNLDADIDDSFCRACLSEEELHKARDFIKPALADRYMRSRGLLRHILGSYLRIAPKQLSFSVTAYGKPFLRNRALHFNVSHSEGKALVAICRKHEIGVDIEGLRPVPEASGIARRWFSEAENEWIRVSPEPERAFLRCWVCREALLKATGHGFAGALDRASLGVEGNTLFHDGPHFLAEPELLPGFAVALACRAAEVGDNFTTRSEQVPCSSDPAAAAKARLRHSQPANRKEGASMKPTYMRLLPALVLFACLLAILSPKPCLALTGREIALKVDSVDVSRTATMSTAMIVKRGSQQLVRSMTITKKKYPDDEKQLIRFLEPGDIRNTAYLTWTYKDIRKGDDMWVYMPAEALVRRISGGGKKGMFMRSDYANEDISRREIDEDAFVLLPDETFSGVDCHVLEAKPAFPDKTNYSKRHIWVRKDIFLPAKISYFDAGGQPAKELVFGGYKEIQGIWTATRQRMRTLGADSETVLEIREILYNSAIPDDIFQQQDLKR